MTPRKPHTPAVLGRIPGCGHFGILEGTPLMLRNLKDLENYKISATDG